jgi:site-specific DNA recombinase
MAATITTPTTGRELLRVSADDSGRMVSTEQQHGDNQRFCEDTGITLLAPYVQTDAGGNPVAISASPYGRKTRDDLASLLFDLNGGTFGADAVILWALNRGTRDSFDGALLIKTMRATVPFLVVTTMRMVLDMRVAAHRKIARDAFSQAEAESDDKSESVGRAMRTEAADGNPHGRILYGYRRTYRIHNGSDLQPGEYRLASDKTKYARQIENPDVAPAIRAIWPAILAGKSLAAIARESGMGWTPARVRDIALNVHYAGKRRHVPGYRGGHQPEITDADLSPAPWPALVSYPDWRKVSAILRNPARRTSPPGRAPAHLVSLIATAPCGGVLSVRTKSDRPAYTCREDGCVTVSRDDLDAYVTGAVLALMTDPQAWAMMGPADDGSELEAAREALAAITAEHAEFMDLVGAGQLSPMMAAKAEPAILARRDAVSKRVRELETPAGMAGLGLAPGPQFAARWDAAPMTARRAVVRTLFASIVVSRAQQAGAGRSVPAADRTEITRRS